MFSKLLADQFFRLLDNIPNGQFEVECPDGQIRLLGQGNSEAGTAKLSIHDWSMIPIMMRKGDIGLTEAYRDGLWSTPDLTKVLVTGMQGADSIRGLVRGGFLTRAASRMKYLMRTNSIKGSRKNIQAHYDLGNDFYQLWLDSSMTYSSAIFDSNANALSGNERLNLAQLNKYDRILDQLDKQSGSLLEVGCGWGGFADRALETRGFGYKGITLSEEQKSFADSRLGDTKKVQLQDYRHQSGLYDNIVSIEMFEAVGESFWPVYFEKLKSLLTSKGSAVVQTITIRDESFEAYRLRGDMFRTFIFPGGMLPSKTRFKEEANRAGLQIADCFDFGQDYATTVQLWLNNFESRLDEITALGFDDAFIRVWRFYLAACIAGFVSENTSVMQAKLVHA